MLPTINPPTFQPPNQNLLQLITKSSTINRTACCNVRCCVPPPDTLIRDLATVAVLEGVPFYDSRSLMPNITTSSHSVSLTPSFTTSSCSVRLTPNFMLFKIVNPNEQTVLQSADILLQPTAPSTYSNLVITYEAIIQGNDDVTIRWYSFDNIYAMFDNRYRLLPDILNGQLSEYNTTRQSLVLPLVQNLIVKVSDNVTRMKVTVGFAPTPRLLPCSGILYSCIHHNHNHNCSECYHDQYESVPVIEYSQSGNQQLTLTTIGEYIHIRQSLLQYITDTSISLLLPLIPHQFRMLTEEKITFEGASVCNSNTALSFHCRDQDDNWIGSFHPDELGEDCFPNNCLRYPQIAYNTTNRTDAIRQLDSKINITVSADVEAELWIKYVKQDLQTPVPHLVENSDDTFSSSTDDQLLGVLPVDGQEGNYRIVNLFPQTTTDVVVKLYTTVFITSVDIKSELTFIPI